MKVLTIRLPKGEVPLPTLIPFIQSAERLLKEGARVEIRGGEGDKVIIVSTPEAHSKNTIGPGPWRRTTGTDVVPPGKLYYLFGFTDAQYEEVVKQLAQPPEPVPPPAPLPELAFPCHVLIGEEGELEQTPGGLTVRDYFATEFANTIFRVCIEIKVRGQEISNTPAEICEQAYEMSDAMMKARAKKRPIVSAPLLNEEAEAAACHHVKQIACPNCGSVDCDGEFCRMMHQGQN